MTTTHGGHVYYVIKVPKEGPNIGIDITERYNFNY